MIVYAGGNVSINHPMKKVDYRLRMLLPKLSIVQSMGRLLKLQMSRKHDCFWEKRSSQSVVPGFESRQKVVRFLKGQFRAFRIRYLTGIIHYDPKLAPCSEDLAKVGWDKKVAKGILEPYFSVPLRFFRWIW